MRSRRSAKAVRLLTGVGVLGLCLCAASVAAEKTDAGALGPAPPAPEAFAMVFSVGYGTVDHMPKSEAEFEKLLVNLKGAGYNAIHCVYRDWRIPLCRKHGVKMMIDVLAWKEDALTDIRRPRQQATVRAICEKVRGERAVWGYNLWNERLDRFAPGGHEEMNRLLKMLRRWDPTHPVWVGTYLNYLHDRVEVNPGCFGYYDYHWSRGMHWHFALLSRWVPFLEKRDAYLGRWMLVSDYNRNMYTLNTSIAHGLKTGIWFIAGPWHPRTGKWDTKHHFVRIGRAMHRVFPELGRIGRPVAVYSTPTARAPDNGEKKKEGIPAPLKAFPEDHWLQVKQGEAVVGFFRYEDGADAAYFANHNAFAWQGMVVALRKADKPVRAWQFDRRAGKWASFEPGELFSFPLAPGDGELFKFERPEE